MKKVFRNSLFTFILGIIITASIGVYAASQIFASDITYKDTTVSNALDELYKKANSNVFCLFLSNQYGQKGQVGAKYVCNPGDGVLRNFFILAKDDNNVKLIMEQNLSDTVGSARRMTYSTALSYFTTGAGASTKKTWTNVLNVDLPSAQDIADASLIINPKNNWSFNVSTSTVWFCLGSHEQDQPSGPTYCPTSTAQKKASWLFNYTIDCASRGCSNSLAENTNYSYGYWTKNMVAGNNTLAWSVSRRGYLRFNTVTDSSVIGVRPVITVSKSNLAN